MKRLNFPHFVPQRGAERTTHYERNEGSIELARLLLSGVLE